MGLRSLGRYQIRGELGRGTMGVVYRGYDPVLDRDIALKTVELPAGLEPDRRRRFLDRFFLEAKIAAKLIHPNIVVTHDAATDESTETPFIAMELVAGESLQAHLERGRIEWRNALSLIEPLAGALDYAHRAEVVHRDIKPANVLLTPAGVPKIADFGIAKLPDTHLTQSGRVMGTPYFMSPEQLQGESVDGRSDLFSLGALLYNLLTGEPPFRGADLASITQQVIYKSPTPPSELFDDLPPDVDGVLARVMAKKPEERYRSGDDLARDLTRILEGEPPLQPLSFGEKTVEATPTVPEPAEPTPSSSSSGCFVLVLLASVLVAGAWLRWDDVQVFVEPLREQWIEAERRGAVSARASAALADAERFLAEGQFEQSRASIEDALTLARDAKDGESEAMALLSRGRLEAALGSWSKARADLDASASVFAIYDLPERRALAVMELGNLERDLGNFDVAASLYEDAGRFVDTKSSRAMLSLMRGDLESAERGFSQAGDLIRAGAVALARGDAAAAEKLWDAHPDAAEVERWRDVAAEATGDDGTSLLQAFFLAEARTRRDEERAKRLP